jgi:two-component system sensor histidine kinase FlrB
VTIYDSGKVQMTGETPQQRKQLEDAFQVFNQVSEQLADSYHQLQQRVHELNNELASARDERLRQLAEKERLANRLAQLLDALPAAVVVLDGEGLLQQYNPAAHHLLGSIKRGQSWDSIYRRNFENNQSGDEQWLQSGRLVTLTERRLEPEAGRILLLLDITETRQLQERLDRQQRLSAMGEMAAQLAHQIRTPLSSALLYISHLSKDNLPAEKRSRFAQRTRARLLHMERQINDMLAFARGWHYAPEPIAVTGMLLELLQILESARQEKKMHISLKDFTNGKCRVTGNRDALLGAVLNLANNALEHGGEEITLELQQLGAESLEIRIRDDGAGIPKDIQERIFDPFFTTSNDGTGLGLAVAQAVVLSHQGQIKLNSGEQQGTCFQITLPLLVGEELESSESEVGGTADSASAAVRSYA